MKLGFNTLNNEIIATATDPIYAYRHLTELDRKKDASATALRYNAVLVHVPDANEMIRDISALLTVDQLNLARYFLLYID